MRLGSAGAAIVPSPFSPARRQTKPGERSASSFISSRPATHSAIEGSSSGARRRAVLIWAGWKALMSPAHQPGVLLSTELLFRAAPGERDAAAAGPRVHPGGPLAVAGQACDHRQVHPADQRREL